MPVSDYFSATYAEARGKFLAAAQAAGASLTSHTLPELLGPRKELLAVDVAALGPEEPEALLFLVSGTHGVEGFCGSGCQVGYLVDRLYEALPPATGTVLIHALNPYGFAWFRRVNEENIDLNRNFQDFSKPLPSSPAYEAVHDWLVPEEWQGPVREAADAALQQYLKDHGMPAFQEAVSGGQYTRPTGLFYGGTGESWSNRTFRHIVKEHLAPTVKQLALFDLHTGLGPPGYGEPIYVGAPDEGFERVRKWFGPEVTSTRKGTSASAEVTGALPEVIRSLAPGPPVAHVSLEYGTRPLFEVLTALRADHWLHAVRGRDTLLREQIERQMRDAFYVDTPAWKAAVYGRAADLVLRAGRGLAGA